MAKVYLNSEALRQRAIELVRKTPLGWVIEAKERKRTNAQNDRMWAMLGDISEAKPGGRDWKPEQWKAAFMDACGHKPEYQQNLSGDGFLCLGYKSSRLRVSEMSDLIECMNAYCAEHGIVTTEPMPVEYGGR
jgi:hypothetical protein